MNCAYFVSIECFSPFTIFRLHTLYLCPFTPFARQAAWRRCSLHDTYLRYVRKLISIGFIQWRWYTAVINVGCIKDTWDRDIVAGLHCNCKSGLNDSVALIFFLPSFLYFYLLLFLSFSCWFLYLFLYNSLTNICNYRHKLTYNYKSSLMFLNPCILIQLCK